MADSVRLCSSWVLQQQARMGTTFPPLTNQLTCAHMMVSSLEPSNSRCLSEPNLAKYEDFGEPLCQEEGEEDCHMQQEDDEDYLFEFDLDSHDSSDTGDEEEGEHALGEQRVAQQENEEGQAKVSRSRSCSSSTTTSTRSNISGRAKEDSKETFDDFFGSKSSGLGSERRSSSICAENLEEVDSPNCIPSDTEVVSPLLSPDSCLEDESLLEEPSLCFECATRAAVEAGGEIEEKNEPLQTTESTMPKTNTSTNENVENESEIVITVEDHSIEVSPTLRISPGKLESLLGSLEQDKHYPSLSSSPHRPNPLRLSGRVSIASSSPSRQADKSPTRLRKTSSLKSSRSKQAPGRSVRFADILGLELNMIKVFTDEIPRVPISAFTDLDLDPSEYQVSAPMPMRKMAAKPAPVPATLSSSTSLVPMFTQPSAASSSFHSRISQQRICLESAFQEGQNSIAGTVRVVNLSFQKTVVIRWTTNDWASVAESTASFVKGSSREGTDQFRFKLELAAGESLSVGSRIQFCLKYICEGVHWDSNGGANYVFQAFPSVTAHTSSAPQVISGRGWGSSRGAPSGSNLWGPSRQQSGVGSIWGSSSSSSSGRQWGVSPSHHGDDPWLRFM